MKRWFIFFCTVLLSMNSHGQQLVEAGLVAPVTITPLVSNAEIPPGMMLANVDFLTAGPDQYASSALIVDRTGGVVLRKTNPLNQGNNNGSIFNFKRINDTTLTYYTFDAYGGYYLVIDNDYYVIDTVRAVGAIDRTRPHELLILPNGNYLVMGQRFEPIDPALYGFEIKSGVVVTSNTLIENILLQEIDPATGNLVHEWRSLDHVDPVATWDTTKITSSSQIVLLHTNSIDYYLDHGVLKLITSHRASNELMIINWETGVIEERIHGRNKTMIFEAEEYVNDSLDLYGQHYAKITNWNESARIMDVRVFNNRFNIERAEGLVLRLDFQLGTVKKLRSFIASPHLKSTHLGSLDQYGTHNWLVSWGRVYEGRENATGYNQFGIPQFRLYLPDSVDSYRILPVLQDEMDDLEIKRPVITQEGCLLTSDIAGYWQDGSEGLSFEVTEPGDYFIEISYGDVYLRSHVVTIVDVSQDCNSVGIHDVASTSVRAYPNPTDGMVHIDSGSFMVTSLTGQEIMAGSGPVIDLTNQPAGVYLLRTGTVVTRLIKE